ncbi:hypothetical protein M885DRAFT_494659 [Pelagophyceae sp. CCMP2097]|nr:hypothetical protein M885DRAFT_494659 [Pelagophyceae sp. CCMP2097]
MHCAAARGGMRAVLREHSKTWLKDVAVLFADHDEDSTIPGLVAFPERPTTEVGKTFLGFPKYRGADRSLWAVEFAVRHYDFEWLIFCNDPRSTNARDDDNYVDLSILYPFLGRLNATVPLFLTSRVGPIEPAPSRLVNEGYPWQVALSYPMRGETPFFVPPMWAYGGAGYVLSKGLAENVIGAEGWRLCRERIVCHNADVRVTKCVHNFGHGVTLTPPNVAIAKAHHVHEAAQVTALWRAEQAHTTATKRSAAKFKHATQPHGTRGRRRAA